MNTIFPKISWYWRFLIALTISSTLIGVVWIFSKFKEPPKIGFIFTSLLILISYVCLESVRFFQSKFYNNSYFKNIFLRRALTFIGSIFVGTIMYTFLFYLFKWLDYYVNHSEKPMIQHMVSAMLIGFVMSIIFGLVQFALHWKNQFYHSYILNEKFKKEIATANLSILKHQLDPHFMFNNFNTLYYLIDENSELAQKFLKNISTIYRYILQNNDKPLIPAIEEYNVSKQYLEVIKQRYTDCLLIEDTITIPTLEGKKIPPLVMQQLIENAVKHNRIDEKSLLNLTLASNHKYLIIANNINNKRSEHTGKTGLKNIEKRYQYVTTNKVIIHQSKTHFSVSIPLISSTNDL